MAVRQLTLEERLQRFVSRWKDYSGSEIADTQGFIRGLAQCYDVDDWDPGTVFEQHPVEVEQAVQSSVFGDAPVRPVNKRSSQERMDFYLRGVVIWEQKGPKQDLSKHINQLWLYWAKRQTRYLVLCNFREFWIWDTDEKGWQGRPPFASFKLEELPQQPGALEFLRGGETWFAKESERVTREAAAYVGGFLRRMVEASKNPSVDRPRFTMFTLECVFAMFAEDAGIFKSKFFTKAMEKAVGSGDLSPVYDLFDDLDRESRHERSNLVPYVNGTLFQNYPKLGNNADRTLLSNLLVAASDFDWQYVRPEVFGSIFEQALLADERHSAGAHFTSEADIMKVVGPTIIRPWRERINAASSHKDVERLIERMKNYHVLDPACGSGNFLYVAYRELKGLEADLRQRWREQYRKVAKRKADIPPPPQGPYFSIQQLHGIDKLDEAVQLTRVVLWIGEYLVNEELSLGETPLPLTSLETNIVQADALFTEWFPREDDDPRELAIVGNPPFMGRRKLRIELGNSYVEEIRKAYPLNTNADLVTYWYTVALRELRKGERCGFVSTNSIAQNESRQASLDRILSLGNVIHDAWKTFQWLGEASVHVSVVNWITGPYEGVCNLEGIQVEYINSYLTNLTDVSVAKTLEMNIGLSFEGIHQGDSGFIITAEQAQTLIKADLRNQMVVKPFLLGQEVAREIDQTPNRWIIDFNQMSQDEARTYSKPYLFIQEHVYPSRMNGKLGDHAKKYWWHFFRPRPAFRTAAEGLEYYLACPYVCPHVIWTLVSKNTIPSNKLRVVASDSIFMLGILQSEIHSIWAWARGSTLGATTLHYTHSSIFETFPFPPLPGRAGTPAGQNAARDGEAGKSAGPTYDPRVVPDTDAARRVSAVAAELYEKRQAACLALQLGLTKLYNYIKGKTPLDALSSEHQELVLELRRLHEELNAAVCACYGWPEDTWRDENEVLTRLLALNRELAA